MFLVAMRFVSSLLVMMCLAACTVSAHAEPADSAAGLPRSPATWTDVSAPTGRLFTKGDAWFAAATVATVALGTRLDRWAQDEAPENNGPFAVHVSHAAEHLGNAAYIIPAFLVLGAADALEHRSDRAASLVRIVEGMAAAGAAAGVVKLAVGRARPFQTPGDQDVMLPFSGYSSFPSGHTTLAFGLAAAIDKETSAKWVPWVVYPLAGLVGPGPGPGGPKLPPRARASGIALRPRTRPGRYRRTRRSSSGPRSGSWIAPRRGSLPGSRPG
ncbi:MAG: phosphatase PAP2 family protein [Candidatus Eisenbacteria bacterium]|uniref:Phosphatase PAP2 family protein n=1 Tax=Eiseniibacteriota bacterium TaxID=2212470 RepID=A0A538SJJ5_UNCEI|nr:MAG: phosphatase PAP2 family protein [Candidatus Eisenbacteria bacterium]